MAKFPANIMRRNYSSGNVTFPARVVRKRFLDYFVNEKQHQFVKPSPIMSYFDKSIPFVNSGSYSFKNVFTGEEEIEFDKAVNSQKCGRTFGLNCEMFYTPSNFCQHAFIEMLGSWSFGAYGKREACELAWKLLTGAPYNISPKKLFVTFFAGDDNLQLPSDEETRDIWLQLGVLPSHISSLGLEHNFWKSGMTGPCGPCTKISVVMADDIPCNKKYGNQNHPAMMELWNIAFVNYDKNENALVKLPKQCINTGMGLERLTASLQGKISSYDTDLFRPLFDIISRVTKAPVYRGMSELNDLDCSYHSLADLSRLITVAIADNVFPDLNFLLKRTFRMIFSIVTIDFNYQNPAHLIHELSSQIAEELHDVFPEVGNNLLQVKLVTENELTVIKDICQKKEIRWNVIKNKSKALQELSVVKYPDLPSAVEYLAEIISSHTSDTLPAPFFDNVCKIYNLDRSIMGIVANQLHFRIPWKKIKILSVKETKTNERLGSLNSQLKELWQFLGKGTDSSAKYEYIRSEDGTYEFPPISSKVMAILRKGEIVSVINLRAMVPEGLNSKIDADVDVDDAIIDFIFDKTNFIATKNKTSGDKGQLFLVVGNENIRFDVEKAYVLQNFVVHSARVHDEFVGKRIRADADAVLHVNQDWRINLMQNLSVALILKAAIKEIFPSSYLKDEILMKEYVRLKHRILGQKASLTDKATVEGKLKDFISQKLEIRQIVVPTARKLLDLPNIQMLSSPYYPSNNLRVIMIVDSKENIIYNEVSGGVHLSNVADVANVKITKWRMKPSQDLVIETVTGDQIKVTDQFEKILQNDSLRFENVSTRSLTNEAVTLKEVVDSHEELRLYIFKILHMLHQRKVSSENIYDRIIALKRLLAKHKKKLNSIPRESLVNEITSRIRQKMDDQKFSVYFCLLDYKWYQHRSFKVDLTYFQDFPIFLFNYDGEDLHGMSYVPEKLISKNFNAEVWMRFVAKKHKLKIYPDVEMEKYCIACVECPEHRFYEYFDTVSTTARQAAKTYLK